MRIHDSLPKRICIIVPIHNQAEYTIKFLECCCQFSPRPGETLDLVLVDNGSNEENRDKLNKFIGSIRWGFDGFAILHNKTNRMFAAAVNDGIGYTCDDFDESVEGPWKLNHDVYAILNNDILFTADGFNACIDALDRFDMVGPSTNACAGIQNESIVDISKMKYLINSGEDTRICYEELEIINEKHKRFPHDANNLLWLNGFAMFLRGSAVWKLCDARGFLMDSHNFPLSGEEIDMCYQGKLLGLKYGIAPAYFWHFKHVTVDTLADGINYWKDSATKLKVKYPGLFPKQFGTVEEIYDALQKRRNSKEAGN